jgi:hypothetical protein
VHISTVEPRCPLSPTHIQGQGRTVSRAICVICFWQVLHVPVMSLHRGLDLTTLGPWGLIPPR